MLSSANPELSRRAFDSVLEMKASSSVDTLNETSGRSFEALGLPHFALARFFRANRRADTKVIGGRFHAAWSQRYVSHGYAGSSTIASEMLRATAAYTWSDVIAKRGLSPDQARIWREAADFRLTDGLFTPVRWTNGTYAAVVLAGDRPELKDPSLTTSAEILSGYYYSELRRITEPHTPRLSLTARQRECLAWVREGKSSAAISQILGISVLTVDEHVAGACRKLGVRTRVQAAVEAALAGLID